MSDQTLLMPGFTCLWSTAAQCDESTC